MSTLKSKLKSENSLISHRHSHVGDIVSAVSEIYQEEVNISIWQRKLNANIIEKRTKRYNGSPQYFVVKIFKHC